MAVKLQVSHVLVFRSKTRAAKRSENHYPAGASHKKTTHVFLGEKCFINATVASDPFIFLFGPFKSCVTDVMESLF